MSNKISVLKKESFLTRVYQFLYEADNEIAEESKNHLIGWSW